MPRTTCTIYAAPVSHKLSSDWQPLSASALAQPVGDFSIITRKEDGTPQWTYQGEALYTYAGDYAPGEVTGIFSGDKSVQAALAYRNFMPTGIEIRPLLSGVAPLMTIEGPDALLRGALLCALRWTRDAWRLRHHL